MDLRQYDPAMGRWVVQDPVIHHDYSPYSAFDNNPVYWSDPSGADSQLYKDKNGNVVAGSFDGQDALNLFNQYLNSSSKKSEEEVQKMYEFTTSEENNGNGGGGDGKNQNQPKGKLSTATVYIETDGIGHVYIELNGIIFSYGRYNGSYSPSSGAFGPYGDGILLKKEGQEAIDFINERNSTFPTTSYKVQLNSSAAYSYLNDLYNGGKLLRDREGNLRQGRAIDTYSLVGPGGNNCATIVSRALQKGNYDIGIFQSPSSLNQFLFNVTAMKNGFNPGLWGPKR